MTGFTLFIVILVIVAAALGWMAGLLKQVGQIAGVVLGAIVCRVLGPTVNAAIFGNDRVVYNVLTYVLLFALVYALCMFAATGMHRIMKVTKTDTLNHLGGAVFRAAEWLLLLSLLLNLVNAVYPLTALSDDPMMEHVLAFGPWLLGNIRGC